MAPRQRIVFAVLLIFGVFAAACGDDESDGATTDCPDGEVYHEIRAECVDETEIGNGGDNDPTGNDNDPTGNDNDPTGNDNDPTGNDNDPTGNDPSNVNDPDTGCGPGMIDGQSCRPDGTILAGADVTVEGEDCEGNSFDLHTITDGDGQYNFNDVPAGTHTLTVQSGSFSNSEPVVVYEGETTDLTGDGKVCIDGGSVPIAVLEGSYDDVTSLLDGIDVEYESRGGDMGSGFFDDPFGDGDGDSDEDPEEFLRDLNDMNQYDIIFIECGSLWSEIEDGGMFGGGGDMTEIQDNIRQYVENGNSLYVSDLAQPFIQMSIPEAVDFYQDEEGPSGPQAGAVQEVEAEVISSSMQTLLGGDSTSISYTAGSWAIAEDAGSDDSTVHFISDVETTDEQTIDDSALMVTYEPDDGGAAIFTSFHNTDQASEEMHEILEFMIFQL